MPKKILIIKNITHVGPGLLENILQEKNIPYTIIDLEKKQQFPSPENYGAVIVCGGPDSANDQNEKMQNELARIKETIDLGIPYLGICLGLQTMIKTCGGKVVKNPVKEIGFRDQENNHFTVELTEEGKKDPLFQDLEHTLQVFHLHGETVEITKNMKLLATGKFCRNQIIKLDKKLLKKDFETIKENYAKVGTQLFNNFLTIAGF